MTAPQQNAGGRARFPLVDSIRAIGAGMVFITHITVLSGTGEYAIYGDVTYHVGEIGLAMLFAMSGFLLGRPYVEERHGGRPAPGVRAYTRNRILRILPAYYAILVIMLIVPGGFPGFTDPFWPHFALIQIYSESWTFEGLKHSWTLCTESAFYVLLIIYSLAAAQFFRGRVSLEWGSLAVLAAVSPITIFIVFTVKDQWLLALQSLLGFLDYVVIGMALAVLSVRNARGAPLPRLIDLAQRRPLGTWILACVVFLVGMKVFDAKTALGYPPDEAPMLWVARHYVIGITAGLFLIPSVLGDNVSGLPRRILRLRFMQWLGLRSYGFYLWHLPVLFFVKDRGWNALGPAPLLTYAVIAFSATCFFSWASWKFIEFPLHSLKAKPRAGTRAPAMASV